MANANIIIKLGDDDVAAIAAAVVERLGVLPTASAQSVAHPVTQSNYPSSESRTARSDYVPDQGPHSPGEPADPWTGQQAAAAPSAPSAPAQGGPENGSAPGGAPPASAPSQGVQTPACAHGPMVYRRAGVSAQGRAYPAFWACSTPRNAPDKCRSVTA